MAINIGAKGTKSDRRIFKLNVKRKKRKETKEIEEKKTEEEKKKIDTQKKNIIINILNNKKQNIIKENKDNFSKKKGSSNKEKPVTIPKDKKQQPTGSTTISTDSKESIQSTDIENKQINIPVEKKKYSDTEISDYLKIEITHILENSIKDNIYELKKLDSNFYSIEKKIDYAEDDSDIKEIELEINKLLEQLQYIKMQITSLEKTFEFKFPVEEPDNYLIYLVEEYKEKVKNEYSLIKDLKHNKEYKSIIERIVELEDKKDLLFKKINSKKDQFEIMDDQIQEMNENMISIDQAALDIQRLVSSQQEMLEYVKRQVDETVHITEKVEYITKSVNHTFMELFLLMALFKRNLSIKNNVVALTETAVLLNLINKMCTPTKEKVITVKSDVIDYKKIINDCLEDTNKLDNLINNNLNTIDSIRYTFLHDYKECSHLPAYKETMKNLDTIEEDIKTKKDEIKRMSKEIELQLEKNDAKVKKYGNL